jgi:hypothetical protein
MTMMAREQSSLHRQVAWRVSMVLCLRLVEDMTWMVARCIERKTGNKDSQSLNTFLVTGSSTLK